MSYVHVYMFKQWKGESLTSNYVVILPEMSDSHVQVLSIVLMCTHALFCVIIMCVSSKLYVYALCTLPVDNENFFLWYSVLDCL